MQSFYVHLSLTGWFLLLLGVPYLFYPLQQLLLLQHFWIGLLNFLKDSKKPLKLHFLFPHPINLHREWPGEKVYFADLMYNAILFPPAPI